jgi:hypothetical protein
VRVRVCIGAAVRVCIGAAVQGLHSSLIGTQLHVVLDIHFTVLDCVSKSLEGCW